MQVSKEWLSEFIDLSDITDEQIVHELTMSGLEVEEVVDPASSLKGFITARIDEVEDHPDSDHLHVLRVNTGSDILQVVCGAPNVHKGLVGIYAPTGSLIPCYGETLKVAKIRGVESCGMLCSERELNVGEDASGIIELDKNTELGTNVADIYSLNDPVIDLNILQNTAHCLGIYGIARDLSATNIGNLKEFKNHKIETKTLSPFKLEIQDENCLEFNFRYIKNDWYLLYIILQIPVIICSSLLTFVCLKLFSRKRK